MRERSVVLFVNSILVAVDVDVVVVDVVVVVVVSWRSISWLAGRCWWGCERTAPYWRGEVGLNCCRCIRKRVVAGSIEGLGDVDDDADDSDRCEVDDEDDWWSCDCSAPS